MFKLNEMKENSINIGDDVRYWGAFFFVFGKIFGRKIEIGTCENNTIYVKIEGYGVIKYIKNTEGYHIEYKNQWMISHESDANNFGYYIKYLPHKCFSPKISKLETMLIDSIGFANMNRRILTEMKKI